MKLPDEFPETPYGAVAFRLSHVHFDENEESNEPGSLVLEVAGRLPGTEADVVVPFEMTPSMALELVEELVAQYRCLAEGPPSDEEGDTD